MPRTHLVMNTLTYHLEVEVSSSADQRLQALQAAVLCSVHGGGHFRVVFVLAVDVCTRAECVLEGRQVALLGRTK